MMASVRTLSPPGPVPLLDLSFLTEEEKMIIMRVLKADEELRKVEKQVQKRVIEQGRRTQKELSEKKQCACCGKSFVEGEGATCPECNHLVCPQCRKITEGTPGFHCTTCSKAKLIELQSQDYMPILCSNSPPPSLYGSELILKSLGASTEAEEKPSEAVPSQEKNNKTANLSVPGRPKENGIQHLKAPGSPNFTVVRRSESAESLNSLSSVYSEPCGQEDYDIRGKLTVGVWYKQAEEQLYVRVQSAKGLNGIKEDGTSNPYVKIYLLPDKSKQTKRKTGIQKKTTKPIYNEILKYKVPQTDVKTHTLWLSVWDWDKFGRNHFLGEVRLPLSSRHLDDPKDCEYQLQEMEEELDSGHRGMLQLGLKFVPTSPSHSPRHNAAGAPTGTLHVNIMQAKDLPSVGPNGQTSGFVKCYLLPSKSYGSKKKTNVIENSLNPEWQEKITYHHISLQDLRSERVLEVTVWDKDRRGTNEFIGCIRIGPNPDHVKDPKDWMDSKGEELSHWEDMLAHQGEWVEQWHVLRPSTDHPGQRKIMQSSAATRQLRSQSMLSPDLANDETTDQLSPIHQVGKNRNRSASSTLPKKGRKGSDTIDAAKSATLPIKGRFKSKSVSSPSGKMKHSGSTASVASVTSLSRSSKGDYDITGDVMLSVEYKNKELMIHVKRARGLAVPHVGYGFSDPYIKTYLLPDKSKYSKRKTVIKRKTLNPVYNETLRYLVEEEEELKQRAIWLTVWDQDRVGTNKFLGELCLPLSTFNFDKSAPSWYKLQDYAETGILPSAPIPSSSNPPVGGTTTPDKAATESEPQQKLPEEEVPASLETKKSLEE